MSTPYCLSLASVMLRADGKGIITAQVCVVKDEPMAKGGPLRPVRYTLTAEGDCIATAIGHLLRQLDEMAREG